MRPLRYGCALRPKEPLLNPVASELVHDHEIERLEACASDGIYSAGVNTASNLYSASIFSRWWKGTSVLEMGCGDGNTTRILLESFDDVTVVDGSRRLADKLAAEFPSVTVACELFERWDPERSFDTIILNHTLEHVNDAVEILRYAARWLAPGGLICASVPSASSLHRQAAVLLDMLPAEDSLTPSDMRAGHRRVSTPTQFRAQFKAAGLHVEHSGGYWLKPVSNGQTDEWFTPEMVDAFMVLGERYPELAAETYVIASAG
jgi:2-polyprenyl-3-methyl-5-hydroxy-6-metoxy-1,4-benzoquinol methylase